MLCGQVRSANPFKGRQKRKSNSAFFDIIKLYWLGSFLHPPTNVIIFSRINNVVTMTFMEILVRESWRRMRGVLLCQTYVSEQHTHTQKKKKQLNNQSKQIISFSLRKGSPRFNKEAHFMVNTVNQN